MDQETARKLVHGDPEFKALTVRILAAQARLKADCSTDTWRLYLELEELLTARLLRVEDVALALTVTDERDGRDEEL